jgi:hypothetical protein
LEIRAKGLILLGEATYSTQSHGANRERNIGVKLVHRILQDDVERCRAQFDLISSL